MLAQGDGCLRAGRQRPHSVEPTQNTFDSSFYVTAPHDINLPALAAEQSCVARVASVIPLDLINPVASIGDRPPEFRAQMLVPEATVDEHDSSILRKSDIRFTDQIRIVNPETITCSVQSATNVEFRCSVSPVHTAHDPTSDIRCDFVSGLIRRCLPLPSLPQVVQPASAPRSRPSARPTGVRVFAPACAAFDVGRWILGVR